MRPVSLCSYLACISLLNLSACGLSQSKAQTRAHPHTRRLSRFDTMIDVFALHLSYVFKAPYFYLESAVN